MRERYVRPPLVGAERRSSRRSAVWRFRLVSLLLLLALAVLAVWLVRHFSATEQNPGVNGQGRPAPAAVR